MATTPVYASIVGGLGFDFRPPRWPAADESRRLSLDRTPPSEGGFCHYDEDEEIIFVPEMAKFQIGESLKPDDNRVKGIVRELEPYRKCRFFNDLMKRYEGVYHLNTVKPLPSPSEAPSKPSTRTSASFYLVGR